MEMAWLGVWEPWLPPPDWWRALYGCGRIDADGNVLPRDFALEVE